MAERFYVTTPIYYINDVPHLGSAYTTVMADVLHRYAKLRGRDSRFLTGTDEHGLKIQRAAEARGLSPQALADEVSAVFRSTWPELGCAPDDFLRTSEARHKAGAQELWRRIAERGDLYLGHYEGLYCVGCEAYYTEKDLLPGNVCPIHKAAVETVKEESYFFRLSKYGPRLLEHFARHPSFVAPQGRMNEVKSFVEQGLEDLSVSRTTFAWGVPVPGDARHVMYVWFDALSNYWTATRGGAERYWPASVHLVGKDILRFHAIYWPAFLMAAGFSDDELPKQIFAHGFLTYGGQKMSKSLRNTVSPVGLARALDEASGRPFGVDVVRYVLVRAIAFGQDGDFSIGDLLQRYQSELGNTLGNLLNRVLPFAESLPQTVHPTELEESLLLGHWAQTAKAVADALEATNPTAAVHALFSILLRANDYVDKAAPWAVKKRGDAERLSTIAATLVRVLEGVALMLSPVMPAVADAMRAQLGLPALATGEGLDQWPHELPPLRPGAPLARGQALFPRLEREAIAKLEATFAPPPDPSATPPHEAKPEAAKKAPEKREPEKRDPGKKVDDDAPKPLVGYDDFAKIDLRVGLVLEATKVPKKDRLLELRVDLGEAEPRKIVAGLAKSYAPDELVGKRIVVLANLAPRDFGGGLVSQGMLLAAESDGRLFVTSPTGDAKPGSTVK
jgi:methionyl-tRNA synthetase